MFGRLRWLTVLLPALLVGAVELVSDTFLDELLPFPFDTLLVVVTVGILAYAFSTVAFRRIDALAGALAARNAELEARNASARALHRVSVAITALAGLDEILQARGRAGARAPRGGRRRPPPQPARRGARLPGGERAGRRASDPAGELPGDDVLRFIAPRFAVARLAAPLQRGGTTIGLLAVARPPSGASASTTSRRSPRSPTRPPSPSRTPACRAGCASSPSSPSASGSPGRCTTASPRCSAT